MQLTTLGIRKRKVETTRRNRQKQKQNAIIQNECEQLNRYQFKKKTRKTNCLPRDVQVAINQIDMDLLDESPFLMVLTNIVTSKQHYHKILPSDHIMILPTQKQCLHNVNRLHSAFLPILIGDATFYRHHTQTMPSQLTSLTIAVYTKTRHFSINAADQDACTTRHCLLSQHFIVSARKHNPAITKPHDRITTNTINLLLIPCKKSTMRGEEQEMKT